MSRLTGVAAVITLSAVLTACRSPFEIKIGSKAFTESVILGDIAEQLAGTAFPRVTHLRALGGTRILWGALIKGDIDLYPEYTGTVIEEIFSGREIKGRDELDEALAVYGIEMSRSLGFDDTYALAMKETEAERLGITTISQLRDRPDLRFGFSNEFMDRADGWPGLKRSYGLAQTDVEGLEHQLAYRAIESGAIDVTDVYSTDADIRYYRLRVLKDDGHFFPNYDAVFVYRSELKEKAPRALRSILRLQGAVSQETMIELNERVKIEGVPADRAAADFIAKHFDISTQYERYDLARRLLRRTGQHLFLVAVSLAAAIVISIPLGIAAFLWERAGRLILGVVGVIQTIPSLALIVFMIPLLGIGDTPAIVALFLYSLLPIVRNTHSGLHDISEPLRESARALGLPRAARLRLVELPMASRSILSGIKTSAVINVGTATLGALIGAGGYGQPILTGIRLNNIGLILEGAVPAALLALFVQGLFDLSEIYLVPRGLRIPSERD